jgi:2'-5' RNA ligase
MQNFRAYGALQIYLTQKLHKTVKNGVCKPFFAFRTTYSCGQMRCFVAIDIDEQIRKMIAKLQEDIADYDVKLVEPNNLHFTLKFFGEIDKDKIRIIENKLEKISSIFKPFEISILGVDAFPSLGYIKVIWLGVENKELYDLQKAIEGEFSGVFKSEEPKPHLTIARVRTPKHKKELSDFVNKNRHLWAGKMQISEIKLKKSYLSPKGPKYEDMKVFKLG